MTDALRTLSALMADANAADSPAEAERCIAAATNQAAGFQDWDTILDALPSAVPIERRRQLAAQALQSAHKREEIWGFRTVAVLQARAFDEPDAARETLRGAERMLIEMGNQGRALGFYWGILAEAFKVALLDESEARRALNAGWDLAWEQHDVENLGRLANQWAKFVDPSEAAARLLRVEQAALSWDKLGGVIYWWHALGDAQAGRRVRQATLEHTTRFTEALDLVRYWNLYEKESPGVGAALSRAEALAQTAPEWLDLAGEAYAKGEDATLPRRALDRAAELADTAEMKARIASAYVDWFADEEAAERVGPRGVRPDDLRPRQTKLDPWEASASDLFDWLRSRVTRDNLIQIAQADYGHDTQRHLAALEWICRTGLVPLELAWHPGEVVKLTRWSSGDRVNHSERALSCVLLCLSSCEDDLANTGPPLIESCLALGEDAPLMAERLLVWQYETADPEAGEGIVSLLLLFMLRAAREPSDPRLATLLRRMSRAPDVHSLREWMAGSLQADLWTRLIDTILTPLHRDRPALSKLLAEIGLNAGRSA